MVVSYVIINTICIKFLRNIVYNYLNVYLNLKLVKFDVRQTSFHLAVIIVTEIHNL